MGGRFAWVNSTVGKKVQMAATGLLLSGFVFAHMAGNLKVFQGAEKFNQYAEFLRELGAPVLPTYGLLWILRIILLGAILLHGYQAYDLTRRARSARVTKYAKSPDLGFAYASRTMRWGGVIVAAFVVYHLLHLTVGVVHQDFIVHDAYHNLVTGLANPLVAVSYAIAVSALALHIYHGLWSATRTFGVGGSLDSVRRPFVLFITAVLWLGYLIIPAAVQIGVLRP